MDLFHNQLLYHFHQNEFLLETTPDSSSEIHLNNKTALKFHVQTDDIFSIHQASIHHTFHKRADSAVNELNINEYDGTSNGSAEDSDTHF